jgi:drug/metabolite transporter (DMT)-like permease
MQLDARKGALLGFVGGAVISFDVPMIRLAGADAWSSLAIRSGCLMLLFVPLAVWLDRKGRRNGAPLITVRFLEVAALYGLSNICFTWSVFTTSTANLVFILALNPLIAALFAWFFIGERPQLATWLAIIVTIFGVGLIVAEGFGKGTIPGDFAAFGAAVSIALLLVRSRQTGSDYSLAPGFGGIMTFVFCLPIALLHSPMPQAPLWLFANGLLAVPISAFCLALAPRYIPAPQVAMFYLLETVLAPVWVWLVFGETVSLQTLAGGVIVLCAIVAHSLWSISE